MSLAFSSCFVSSLGDLADVLQQVVRLNDEIRPHLQRYQELLRSGADREVSIAFVHLVERVNTRSFDGSVGRYMQLKFQS